MNPFPEFSSDPFTGGVPNRETMRRFPMAMEPFWNAAQAMLPKLRPQGWVGYRCDVEVRWDPSSGRYLLGARICDGVTNRSKALTSKPFLDLIACLHDAYRRFDSQLEWKRVRFTQMQDAQSTQWRNGIEWEYGRSVQEAGSGEGGKLGNS